MDTKVAKQLVINACAAWSLGSAEDVARDSMSNKGVRFIRAHAAQIDSLAQDLEELVLLGMCVRHRDKLFAELPPGGPDPDYVAEAENQDGYTYWLQFDTPEELAEDLERYQQARAPGYPSETDGYPGDNIDFDPGEEELRC